MPTHFIHFQESVLGCQTDCFPFSTCYWIEKGHNYRSFEGLTVAKTGFEWGMALQVFPQRSGWMAIGTVGSPYAKPNHKVWRINSMKCKIKTNVAPFLSFPKILLRRLTLFIVDSVPKIGVYKKAQGLNIFSIIRFGRWICVSSFHLTGCATFKALLPMPFAAIVRNGRSTLFAFHPMHAFP